MATWLPELVGQIEVAIANAPKAFTPSVLGVILNKPELFWLLGVMKAAASRFAS